MKQTDLIVNKNKMYRLFENESHELYLAVILGGIAMYEVIIKLKNGEVQRFQKEGEDFIGELAQDIIDNHEDYEQRFVY